MCVYLKKNEMNQNEKIQIVVGLNDFLVGGVQHLALDQFEGLKDEKFEFHLITLMQFEDQGDFYNFIPDHVHVHKLYFSGFRDIKSWVSLYKLLRKIKPRIVKTSLFFSNTVFRLLKPLVGYSIIAAEHNTENKRTFWQRFINRILANVTYTIVADSLTVADFLVKTEHISRDKFTVIYNGVDIQHIQEFIKEAASKVSDMRRDLGILPHEKVFLNIARMAHQKNHALMIDSFIALCKTRDDLRLILVGDGRLRAEIEEQIQSSPFREKIIFTGEQKNIYPYYVISDYFLLTSRREGFCITAMTGLAFGLPLVSTKVAGVVEYTENNINGFLAEHTVESVFENMQKVLNLTQKQYCSFQESARNTASNFSVEIYIKKYKHMLDDVLANS